MVDKETLVEVTNRDNGSVGYYVQDLRIRRDFQPGETKEISAEELRKLSYSVGGKALIQRCLVIKNNELVQEILGVVEPEYFYSEKDVKNLLLGGSVEQLMDCLDFAPSGVIDLVKSLAVELEINDLKKRNVIFEKTGFNVNRAIEINKETADEGKEVETSGRRATPIVSEEQKAEKKSTYKIVSTEE